MNGHGLVKKSWPACRRERGRQYARSAQLCSARLGAFATMRPAGRGLSVCLSSVHRTWRRVDAVRPLSEKGDTALSFSPSRLVHSLRRATRCLVSALSAVPCRALPCPALSVYQCRDSLSGWVTSHSIFFRTLLSPRKKDTEKVEEQTAIFPAEFHEINAACLFGAGLLTSS